MKHLLIILYLEVGLTILQAFEKKFKMKHVKLLVECYKECIS